jgi:hypothetical protein
MTLLGIGFVVLCYYWGKAELVTHRTKAFLAVAALLPDDERMARARAFLEQDRGNGQIHASTEPGREKAP